MNTDPKFQSGQVPLPPREHGPWVLAIAMGTVAVAVLVAVLSGLIGGTRQAPAATPPAILVSAPTPSRALAVAESHTAEDRLGHTAAAHRARALAHSLRAHIASAGSTTGPIVNAPTSAQQEDLSHFHPEETTHIFERWVQGFYPIYEEAQRTFDVNWLLIASIHKQETAFSTAPSTYHGLNFAHCCGGPMQFNVTNGPITTWRLVRDAYKYGKRPAVYDHMTATHPSIYDDFDSIMAAAWLLSANGARFALNDSAWWAAYDYYGHDAYGVTYADQVLARAISWSQHGFCINCELDQRMVTAVYEAYGAPVLASLEAAEANTKTSAARSRRAKRAARAKRTRSTSRAQRASRVASRAQS